MNEETLDTAIEEARRFLRYAAKVTEANVNERVRMYYGSKETAAVKRASMDLTRALAAMRKPG